MVRLPAATIENVEKTGNGGIETVARTEGILLLVGRTKQSFQKVAIKAVKVQDARWP
jgi:hypothetical protein